MDDTTRAVAGLLDALTTREDHGDVTEDWVSQLERISHTTQFDEGDMLIEQHAVADHIHFLVEGQVRYSHPLNENGPGETISHTQAPWMPIGWSGLHFGRYRATVVTETAGHLLSIPFGRWRGLVTKAPELRARLSEFMFHSGTQLLRVAQGLTEDANTGDALNSRPGSRSRFGYSVVAKLLRHELSEAAH